MISRILFSTSMLVCAFASWTKTFDESDVAHEAVRADGTRARNVVLKAEGLLAENDVKALEPAK